MRAIDQSEIIHVEDRDTEEFRQKVLKLTYKLIRSIVARERVKAQEAQEAQAESVEGV